MLMSILILPYLIFVVSSQYDATDWTFPELLQIAVLGLQIRDGDVEESDVNLYLYTRNNPTEPIWLEHHGNHKINNKKPTKIIIHGYLENYRISYMRRIREEFLKLEDVNVIHVDWKRVARSYYMSAAKNTIILGNIVGSAVVDYKIPASKLHLIGFSLGAHVSGFAAKRIKKLTGKQVDRITALDPAGPYFRMESILEDDRLNSKDARIVDVIHTDGGFLGYTKPIGTFDIYANGGKRRQPGCNDGEPSLDKSEFIMNVMCSHLRATAFFIQSLTSSNITCNVCDDFESVEFGTCSENNVIIIMNQKISDKMRGICAFSTSDSEPYF